MSEIQRQQAMILFERAYRHQMQGELADAIQLYKRSLELFPTSEAHTFLGWTYSLMSRYEEAIDECKKAIALDPTYGNPYNDIGAYLIELEQWEEAMPWLQKATEAPRYEVPQFAHANLGRVHEHFGRVDRALAAYDLALQLDPLYRTAFWAKYALLASLN